MQVQPESWTTAASVWNTGSVERREVSYHHDVLRDEEKDVPGVCREHPIVQLLHQLLGEVGDVCEGGSCGSFCAQLRLFIAWGE